MSDETKILRMKELVDLLNRASKAYYAEDREIMSNREYDELYDELVSLEGELGTTLSNSPTVNVGYEAVDELPKERHATPMLSLAKTKEREELVSWLGDNKAILSWKLDGLTVVLTYTDGKLAKAVTRGNGEIGEVITPNARQFTNIPLSIPFKGELVLRGEAVISYSDFEKINSKISVEDKYKNPRNLCSGSVRQLDSRITAERHVRFIGFSYVSATENGTPVDLHNSKEEGFKFLEKQGFETVERVFVTKDNILSEIEEYARKIETYDIPSDGLVLTYDDLAYSASLGRTAKTPRDSIAFKWADELRETTLKEIEWSASRTGLINPVAIFEPVELEGTTVSRASVHNISILKGLKLGIGDRITVYKANMIIPQINENLTCSDSVVIPSRCPVCGSPTRISTDTDVQSLYCDNPTCPAKQVKSFTLFVSRDALNMEGLSESTLEKFIDMGFIKNYRDMFHLDKYEEAIIGMEGFGEKSYANIIASVDASRNTTLARLLYGLGIENIGVANAKMIAAHFDYDLDLIRRASLEELSAIEGVGDVIARSIRTYFDDEKNKEALEALLPELNLVKPEKSADSDKLKGLTFVITGSLNGYENRDELKNKIEEMGGKVAGSVSKNTECLINNDATSNSSKNKKAKELGVKILTEEEFEEEYFS